MFGSAVGDVTYHGQLLESELEALGVVGDPFGRDVLHAVLQHLLVPHVGLDQAVEAGRVVHYGVELRREAEKEA